MLDAATFAAFGLSTWVTDAGALDLLVDLRDRAGGRHDYEDHIDRSAPQRVGDIVVNLASLEDIIESKRYANSAKDREALPEIDSLRRHVSDPHNRDPIRAVTSRSSSRSALCRHRRPVPPMGPSQDGKGRTERTRDGTHRCRECELSWRTCGLYPVGLRHAQRGPPKSAAHPGPARRTRLGRSRGAR